MNHSNKKVTALDSPAPTDDGQSTSKEINKSIPDNQPKSNENFEAASQAASRILCKPQTGQSENEVLLEGRLCLPAIAES